MSVDQAMIAVGELIKTQRLRVDVTPTVGYDVKAPCLLAQLYEAIGLGSERGGRGVPGSRPNVAVDALDLWTWIATDAHAWADSLGLARRDPQPHHAIPWIGRLLRSCAATAASTGRAETAERIERNAETWARLIRAMLTGQVEQRGVRGAKCPECETTSLIETRREERRDVEYRVPAIILVTRDIDGAGVLRWLTCLSCGWNWPINESGVTVEYTSESGASLDGDLVEVG